MNKLKLLVVEHNQSISGKISQIPGIKDYLLLYASSQEETLKYLKSDAEIVIMVIENTLAGSDFRLLPLIKTINPFLRMIIVTDDWNLTEIRKAMNNGVIDVLVQPLEANDLKEALKNLTDFKGVTGYTSFKENGDSIKQLYLLQIENNTFVQLNRN